MILKLVKIIWKQYPTEIRNWLTMAQTNQQERTDVGRQRTMLDYYPKEKIFVTEARKCLKAAVC